MQRSTLIACAALAVCGWSMTPVPARAADRTAKEILAELDKVTIPQFDPKDEDNQKAIEAYLARREEVIEKRSALLRELVKIDPENERLPALLSEHWQNQMTLAGPLGARKLTAEIDEVLARTKNPKLKADGAYFKTVLALQSTARTAEAAVAAVEEFLRAAPKDERGPMLLYSVASDLTDPDKQKTLYKRVLTDYPDSRPAKMIEGYFRKLDGVGKPFDLEFTDAITAKKVSMKDLRGKVVVIDFWATWCGPCVAAIPSMKKLYEEVRGQGVEFIGVSLDEAKDEGGFDTLKEFVAKNEIKWPQYYQGGGPESAFSMSWGVDSIPCMFVVDQEGKLFSVDAQENLEEIISELLKKGRSKGN
jgi:thiol-disulfide isomerase/thioredoxin